jgi:osmotically-inducible protein OsmY
VNNTPGSQAGPYTGYGPSGYRRSDENILEDICDRLTQHAEIDASDIEVKVKDGEVILTGTVEDKRIKRLVEANVEMIPGVVDVVNELGLRHPPTREEIAAEETAREMADKFPGGPTPTGNAGY